MYFARHWTFQIDQKICFLFMKNLFIRLKNYPFYEIYLIPIFSLSFIFKCRLENLSYKLQFCCTLKVSYNIHQHW